MIRADPRVPEAIRPDGQCGSKDAAQQCGQAWPALCAAVSLERPALATDVELIGQLQGTGFEDSQWLVQRDGRCIQLTELLYRVAEQANGERDLADIAARVTENTDWLVSANDVAQLIQRKLLPLGLMARPDGSAVRRTGGPIRSPLQIGMRRRLFGPRALEPLAGALQILYTPPVLIFCLILVAAAHGWLYFVHGIDLGLNHVLYSPWLLLVVFPLIVTSALFHELGHAAGLRYGGGKARGIGMGFYVVYPTFYADTTDAYRLSRWARLRTDLGGFYFHLLFALGLIALSVLSGQEFLLFVVFLINLDILYQCLPHVRFDGYWILADLTGVPDLFSQARVSARGLPGMSNSNSGRGPRLKPWASVAVATYILLTVPMLAGLAFLVIALVPTRAVTVWDSLLNQLRGLFSAQASGDVLGVATSAIQMLILMLLISGFAYMLFSLSRSYLSTVWSWSKPSLTRRIVGAVGTLVTVGLLARLWLPQVPYTAWAWTVPAGPPGTQTYGIPERFHVQTAVDYPQVPPVGGKHAAIWQNCGFYDTPVRNEHAVHAMEHGAVWIAYRPDLPTEQIAALRKLAHERTYLVISPFPDLPAPLVASAWGRQLQLAAVDDPRLGEFVQAFRLGRQAPESGERCTGGVGVPS